MSNGCTASPDFNFKSCCDQHDDDYENGATIKEKIEADKKLFWCVYNKPPLRNKLLAVIYFGAVSIFGFWGFYRNKK